MNKTELDNLFDRWRQKQENEWQKWNEGKEKKDYLKRYREHADLKKINPAKSFTPDGIIDEEAWNNGKKILFILKEANGKKQLGEDEKENTVEIDKKYGFWFKGSVEDENCKHSIKSRLIKISNSFGESQLKAVAYMNINKRGGTNSELVDVLNSYIKEYEEYIKKEIEIISPEIICICCGKNKAYVNKLEEIIQESKCNPRIVKKYYHPSARIGWEKYEKGVDNIKN